MQKRGVKVTVIHILGHLMDRQRDPAAGDLLQKTFEARGITEHCKGATKAILGVTRDAGLEIGRGITVNDQMQSADPSIYALGECIEHNQQLFGRTCAA